MLSCNIHANDQDSSSYLVILINLQAMKKNYQKDNFSFQPSFVLQLKYNSLELVAHISGRATNFLDANRYYSQTCG